MATDNNNSKTHFWDPWGVSGLLWRTVSFLAGGLLICFLLSLLTKPLANKEFSKLDKPVHPGWDTIVYPQDPYRQAPPDIRRDEPVKNWGDSIPDVPELPSPRDNRIPPVNPSDTSRVAPNPVDSLSTIVADELIVFFNSQDLKADMTSFAQQFKQHYPSIRYNIVYYNLNAGTMLLGVPNNELVQIMNALPLKITGIDFIVTINEVLNETFIPDDSGFRKIDYDEYYRLIQAYDAWDVTKGSPDVKIAIVDSYFDLTNPEIGERYVDPISIPTKTTYVLPPSTPPANPNELGGYCHGTHVAGLAIGKQNNSVGCSGIAPECSWIPISVGDQMTTFNIIEGILYGIYRGADVVNTSLGRSFYPFSNSNPDLTHVPFEEQVDYAENECKRIEQLWEYIYKVADEHRCIICTASGNDYFLTGMDPMKRSQNIIKVEAVDNNGIKADFSNYGNLPEENINFSTVVAPGVRLWSATPVACVPYWKLIEPEVGLKSSMEGFQEMSGTSMSSPVVAGAIGLLKSKKKDLTAEEAINILRLTSKQTDSVNHIGPTLQIRSALDATGGELLNFDELMNNHDMIVGKWKSTYALKIVKEESGEKIDEAWCYMVFTTTTSGMIEFHYINQKELLTAPLTVKWHKNSIEILQHGNATSPNGVKLNKDDYLCKPNSERLLEATTVRNGTERFKFQLEKVY